jgi:hypothetical protein
MDVKAAKYASSRTGALYTLFTCLFREQNVWMTGFSLSLSLQRKTFKLVDQKRFFHYQIIKNNINYILKFHL